MNSWIASINKLTFGRALILGIGFAGFYYFFFYDDGARKLAAIQSAQSQIERLNTQIHQEQNKLNTAEKYKEVASQVGTKINALLKVIPEHFDISDLMKIVSDQVKDAGLSLDSITPGTTEPSSVGKAFDEVSVNIKTSGTFSQQMIFLSGLTRVNQILIVRKLKMSVLRQATAEELPVLSMATEVVAYRYRGAEEKKPGATSR